MNKDFKTDDTVIDLENKEEIVEKKVDTNKQIVKKPKEKTKKSTTEKVKKEKREATQEEKIRMRKSRRVFTGVIFTFLALVGVISIVMSGTKVVTKMLDNTAEKEVYNKLLTNYVMYDPLPFESYEKADKKTILLSSIWAAIMNEDMTGFETNEYGETYLPATVIDKYFVSIFGSSNKLEYISFEDQGINYEFNEDKKAYTVPVTSYPVGYIPQVDDIKTSFPTGNEKQVTVGYLYQTANSWEEVAEITLVKYVDYIFEKQDSEYILVAVRESEKQVELVATPSPKPEENK